MKISKYRRLTSKRSSKFTEKSNSNVFLIQNVNVKHNYQVIKGSISYTRTVGCWRFDTHVSVLVRALTWHLYIVDSADNIFVLVL